MITGPVKFQFNTGTIKRQALAFWCVMMERKIFDEIGLLDEIFSPGMGEDGDFCIRAEMAGHELVQVPNDHSHEFGTIDNTKPWSSYPMFHKGSGTFGWLDAGGLIERNKQILNERYGEKIMPVPKYSIVIPTYNHCEDLLKPCLESIIKYSDMSQIEVIVVANGCVDNTREYVESLGDPFRLVWIDEPSGYTKSTNEGIKVSRGEYVILLNNDTEILDSKKQEWIDLLEAPFKAKKNVGLTGPLQLYDEYAASLVLIFFCVMIKREVFEKIGLLDEIFSPGGGEDIDFSVRAKEAGYAAEVIAPTTFNGVTNIGSFPIWHKDNKTFGENPDYTNRIVKVNGLTNCLRYNKNIKLNLGGGNIHYPGFLSVDMYDRRSHILMDITNLKEFKDNTVTEIMASHVFEHLNPWNVLDILKEWMRVLKPGGKLSMEMPDIEKTFKAFETANKADRYGLLNTVYGCVNTTNVGTNRDITSPHLFGWWPEAMWDTLNAAGYTNITFGPEQWPHPGFNFRVEAIKPVGVVSTPPKTTKIDHEKLKLQEKSVYDEVFTLNVYQALEKEIRDNVVVDIGANLGFFSLRCIEMGAKQVIAVEAQPTIYTEGLLQNIKDYEQITSINAAAYSTDDQVVLIPNHNANSIVGSEGEEVKTITLKKIVEGITTSKDMCLKLDCEGSEYDILLSTENDVLRRFKHLYIEMHDTCNINPEYRDNNLLRERLISAGFKQEYTNPMLWFEFNSDGSVKTSEVIPGITVEKWIRKETLTPDHEKYLAQEPITYNEIFVDNAYKLTKEEIEGKVVIDVGANLGFFSILCRELGAKKILAVEAQPTIYKLGLLENIKHMDNITPINAAVFDVDGDIVFIPNNHVASVISSKEGESVVTTTLKTLIKDIEGDDLVLKLDCEGSEFEIILSVDIQTLRRFETINIELHENTHENPLYHDVNLVRKKLMAFGFKRISLEPALRDNCCNEKWIRL